MIQFPNHEPPGTTKGGPPYACSSASRWLRFSLTTAGVPGADRVTDCISTAVIPGDALSENRAEWAFTADRYTPHRQVITSLSGATPTIAFPGFPVRGTGSGQESV
ncbi:hypothetical protein U3C44_23440 (plasmid) [Enterobacter asburiae]|uniref:hypothetical protein n=1 Tax=Enterobacter asburiae TaxID=61645 RepID=UPI0029333D75|nr:hypothetical protein [Enterobacter asburiae]EMA4739431.1 hypothetical protein [Enterobacter asburiae]